MRSDTMRKYGSGHYWKYLPELQAKNELDAVKTFQFKNKFGSVFSGNDAIKATLLPYGFNSRN